MDNIPKVAPTRQEKLRTVIEKLFSAIGPINREFYPVDDEGNTKGYAFLEYSNQANAEEAVRALNNHRLDKAHTFQVNLFTDFQKYEHIPEQWEVPQPQPYRVQNDLYSFWTEPDAYDQYCVAAETAPNAIQVQFWQNTLPEPNDLETRDVSIEYTFWCFDHLIISILVFCPSFSVSPTRSSSGRRSARTWSRSTSRASPCGAVRTTPR